MEKYFKFVGLKPNLSLGRKLSLVLLPLVFLLTQCSSAQTQNNTVEKENPHYDKEAKAKINISDAEWKQSLDDNTYHIAREKGTERAFTGAYWNSFDQGAYHCKACGRELFVSDAKFESSCGWPSFFEAVDDKSIIYLEDNTHGMKRVEVQCGRCEAHLGHIFDDGPPPTGKRFCINGGVIQFEKK